MKKLIQSLCVSMLALSFAACSSTDIPEHSDPQVAQMEYIRCKNTDLPRRAIQHNGYDAQTTMTLLLSDGVLSFAVDDLLQNCGTIIKKVTVSKVGTDIIILLSITEVSADCECLSGVTAEITGIKPGEYNLTLMADLSLREFDGTAEGGEETHYVEPYKLFSTTLNLTEGEKLEFEF